MRLYAAVGHGIRPEGTYDPGAGGGGQTEQWAGDIVVAEMVKHLRSWGVTTKSEAFTNDPNYRGTAAAANSWKADAVVSVHHDYSLAPIGFFCHWYMSSAKPLADAMYREVEAAGFTMRPTWHKYRSDLYLLKHTDAPSVIVECGRIGQYNEAQLKELGRLCAQGIAKWGNINTKEDDVNWALNPPAGPNGLPPDPTGLPIGPSWSIISEGLKHGYKFDKGRIDWLVGDQNGGRTSATVTDWGTGGSRAYVWQAYEKRWVLVS